MGLPRHAELLSYQITAVVFCGGEEEKNGQAKIKEMKTGEETIVSLETLADSLKSMLTKA